MEDENYSILKDEAIKTKQALEKAFTEKETHKEKLVSVYRLCSKTEDELKAIFLEIESDRENFDIPLNKDYHKSYWKWKDADEEMEIAKTKLNKYEMHMKADIPDVMIELKELKKEMQVVKQQNEELKSQNEEVKKEMQEMKAMLTKMMSDLQPTLNQHFEIRQMVREKSFDIVKRMIEEKELIAKQQQNDNELRIIRKNSEGWKEAWDSIPDEFLCPITLEIMKDPVSDNEGNSYEREAVEDRLKRGNTTSPITKQPLQLTDLRPNRLLREVIKRWQEEK